MWDEIKYRWTVFHIAWLRPSAYINRFKWDVIEPIKIVLYRSGHISEKPLRLVCEELNAEMHPENKP